MSKITCRLNLKHKFIITVSILLASLFLASVAVPQSIFTEAEATTYSYYITSGSGTLYDYQDYNRYGFTLSEKSKLELDFSSSTHGYLYFEIRNSKNTVVYKHTAYTNYDSLRYVKTLANGTYNLYIYNNDYDNISSLYYYFNLYRLYTPPKNPTSLKLNKKGINIDKESGYPLTATYKPSDVSSTIKWSSSNKKVATVSDSGYVYGVKLGKATITAKMGNKKAKCTVYVNKTYVEIAKGKSKSLKSLVKNAAGYKKAKWHSNKKAVVSVSKKGKIKTKKHGNTVVVAKIKGKKYKIEVYSYSKKKLKKETVSYIKDLLVAPSSLKIGTVKYIDFKTVKIYYSAYNKFGERIYSCRTGYYDQGVFNTFQNF